ncbi:uncharacterized protein DSM5745_02739 [Aspergillus mulundensis]|uniref:Heterokaryon incompatibility domain-containing protein n=1 Tax=Aspergillus mulundensis TaxID=1810919 RepID=A0A3D8SIE7_9EURO|nr:hypothetical protein DSM5745_02739 [Aspergillus mulundensis]RDW86097.1 hypothetical protein DSM5745_02739 [Aspergillus mulundensis]
MGASQSSNHSAREESLEWGRSLQRHYNGDRHWASGRRSERPKLTPGQLEARRLELSNHRKQAIQADPDASADTVAYSDRPRRYLNFWGNDEHEKYPDLDVYYSSTKGFARRLVVQATDDALDDKRPRHWDHKKLTGNAPFVIRLAEICLDPFDIDRLAERIKKNRAFPRRILLTVVLKPVHFVLSAVLTLLLAWIIQILISVQVVTSPWTADGSVEPYEDYENVHWKWPRHAVNVLDQAPKHKEPQSDTHKLMIPKRLVVKGADGNWEAQDTKDLRDRNTGMLQPYIFLSFTRASYPADDSVLRPFFHSVGEAILEAENKARLPDEPLIKAFWVDTDCVSHESGQWAEDVNTICDAVRCARRVYILLPSDGKEDKRAWGERIWTLPEALLAAEKLRYYCVAPNWQTPVQAMSAKYTKVSLSDMRESFWPAQFYKALPGQGSSEDAISHLVDHYTNRTQLSELQLITYAVQALARLTMGKDIKGYEDKHLAYAAMGLLAYRLRPDEDDKSFQAIARLSLVNDSNELVERLLCLWPKPTPERGPMGLLSDIAEEDQYRTHLWDIHPLCSVVGIGDDDDDEPASTVVLDRCRGIPIRWKSFPRLSYARDMTGFRASLSQWIVYLGAWFFLAGFNLFGTVALLAFSRLGNETENETVTQAFDESNLQWSLLMVLLYMAVGWVISWFSPLAVRQLCNSGTKGVSCHLFGFEGTSTLYEIETKIYGNHHDRLSYAPSSTPFCKEMRHDSIRQGEEPDSEYWNRMRKELNVPDSHRLFTIVDTGSLSVSVIAAERPPVVALICGREGGMLRTVLCSWRFETNTLYREGVMRMRSSLEEIATPNDWLKISFASQGDVNRMRGLARKET